MERLGFVGLGVMGAPMAQRLARAGFPLVVWNRAPDKMPPVVAAGAEGVKSPTDVMSKSDVVHLCVYDTAAVEAVVFGPDGLARAGRSEGKLVVDHSTIDPDATRHFAERLERETGARWVDAPVSGGVPGAEAGTLVIMAGGAEADLARLAAILKHVSQRVTHMGPVGAGQVTKLCNQMLVGCTMTVVAEVLQLAARSGVDVLRLPACLADGYADSVILRNFALAMARGEIQAAGLVTTLMKDLGSAVASGSAIPSPMPMTALAAELHKTLVANLKGAHDGLGIMRLYGNAPLTGKAR